jgi:hypothetical protein
MMPNLMLSLHPDYVNYYLLSPIGVDRTIVTSEWLFHPGNAGDSAFDPEDPVEARTLFLNAFEGERIRKVAPFSDTILSFAPYVFAARAYDHFVTSSDACVLLRQVMSGEIDVAADMANGLDERP